MAYSEQPSLECAASPAQCAEAGSTAPAALTRRTLLSRLGQLGLASIFGSSFLEGCPTPDDDDSADDSVSYEEFCAETPAACDADLDGFNGDEECDDFDPDTHPGAEDYPYDGIDQDCNGEDLTDVDGDGSDATQAGGEDCDDGDPSVNPEALEVCDGEDQDCDGEEDEAEDLDPTDPSTLTWGPDQDGDGAPECGDPIVSCERPDDIEVPGGQPIQYLSCNEEGLAQ